MALIEGTWCRLRKGHSSQRSGTRLTHIWWTAAALLILTTLTGTQSGGTSHEATTGNSSARQGSPDARNDDLKGASATASISAATEARLAAEIGRVDAVYHASTRNGRVRMDNPRHGIAVAFTSTRIAFQQGSHRWVTTFRGYGYGDRLLAPRATKPHVDANRVQYRRAAMTEWYVNGPSGVEQGFTVERAPGKSNGEPLTFAFDWSGNLTASVDADRRGLTLTKDGGAQLRYAGLAAWDADDRELATWLEASGKELRLRVDDSKARYPITIDPFVQNTKLTTRYPCPQGGTCDAGGPVDRFGASLSVSANGGVVVIGAPSENLWNGNAGAAYVFLDPGAAAGGWSCLQTFSCRFAAKLMMPGTNLKARFGKSVAVSADGNTIVVGAPGMIDLSGLGSAWVFPRPANGWTSATPLSPTAQLWASNGGTTTVQNLFGASVSISGNGGVIAVGAPLGGTSIMEGGVFVFVRPAAGWVHNTETARLTLSAPVTYNVLGGSVDISEDGTTIVAGASCEFSRRCGISSDTRGAAYMFARSPSGWTSGYESARLLASDPRPFDCFGCSVNMAGNGTTVAIGAVSAAYVYEKPGAAWITTTEDAKLTAAAGNYTGAGVSVSGDGSTIAVGASHGSDPGAVYLYGRPETGWANALESTRVRSSDAVLGDWFGFSSAMTADGSVLFVGAPYSAARPEGGQGSAYVFSGTTTGPIASVAPSSLSFGSQPVGKPSPAQTVTLTNTGTAPLNVASVALSFPGPFTTTQNCVAASPLAPGASCVESVTFTPLGVGAVFVALRFTDDSRGTTGAVQQVQLTGTGVKGSTTTVITTVSPNPASIGEPVSIGYAVSPEAGSSLVPSGTVTVQASTGESCSGSAPSGSCAFIFDTVGDRTITATYSGDSNLLSSASTAVSARIGDFTISVSPASQSVSGRKANYTLTITSVNGFTGQVSLTCRGGPANTPCVVTPDLVSLTRGTAMARATFTLPSGAAAGTYTLTFVGNSGGAVHTATATLTVK